MNVGTAFRGGILSLIVLLVLVSLANHFGIIGAVSSWPVEGVLLGLIAAMLVGLVVDVRILNSDVKTLKTDVTTLKTDVETLKSDFHDHLQDRNDD